MVRLRTGIAVVVLVVLAAFVVSWFLRYSVFLRFVCFYALPYIVAGNKSIPKVLRNSVDTMSGLIHRQRASVKNEGFIMRQRIIVSQRRFLSP